MLPNVFPGAGDHPAYNTADASLWFFEAWRAYVDATGDIDSLREVYPVLSDMIGWHQRGTRYGIGVDAGGRSAQGRRGGRATDLDGRQGRRLGGHAPHRQAGRDQRALVQRLAGDERVRGPIGRAGPLQRAGGSRKAQLRAFRTRGRRGSVRRDRRTARRRRQHQAQPDLCREPAAQSAGSGRSGENRAGLQAPSAHRVRLALAGARQPRLPPRLWGRRTAARRRLSPGAGLGLAAGTVLPRGVSRQQGRDRGASRAAKR